MERAPDNATWRETVEALPAELAPSQDVEVERDDIDIAQRIGRFVPIECIGKGGMGVVWSAYDPQLDRKVAIKLIAGDVHGPGTKGELAATRMLREARALAKLTDPNVVAVYDVGTQEDGLYIAMEFVEGKTLDKHLATKRPWRDVLALFVAAGRGLVAAHAAGLVHRDFKPSNVVVTPTGRVVVLDFGLARAPVAASQEVAAATGIDPHATEGGALLGTPAYMSPEQWRGFAIDARSDQFSFCVALWEALCRTHPFDRTSTLVLAQSVTTGQLREPPLDVEAPSRVLAVVRRGLAKEPEQRWPSMDALLAALAGTERRSGPYVLALGAAAVGAVAWLSLSGARAQDDPCAATGDRVDAVWNDARKDAVRSAFAATEVAFADDAWTRVDAALASYARAWRAAATDACVAAQHGTVAAEQAALQSACHGDALHRFDALVQRLGHASVEGVVRATDVVADLPPLDRCADLSRLRAADPGTSDEESTQIRQTLVELDAAMDIADHEAIDALVPALHAAAARIDDASPIDRTLGAEVLQARARLAWQAHDAHAAIADLDRAAGLAMAAGRDELFSDIVVDLTADLVLSEGSTDVAETWWKMASAAVARAGSHPLRVLESLRLGTLVAITRHELVRARKLATEAEAHAHAHLGDMHMSTLRATGDVARVASLQGDYDVALRAYDEIVPAAREIYGARHPATIDLMTQQLIATVEAGRREGLVARAQEVLTIATAADADVTWALLNLGSALGAEGRWSEADAAFAKGHAGMTGHHGAEYRASGITCERARVAYTSGEPAIAWTRARECEAELRAWAAGGLPGHDAITMVSALVDVAQIAVLTDHRDDARRLLGEIETKLAGVEADEEIVAIAMLARAQLALAENDAKAADAHARAALEWLEQRDRTERRTYLEALALAIDTARWAGDRDGSASRATLATNKLRESSAGHLGARRRLWLAIAGTGSAEALDEAKRLAAIAPVDPELELRERIEVLRRAGDDVALGTARSAAKTWSPALRRFALD
ncbi:MAG TPA: serine/threonine-protein kinase [Nannocystaceae bacterium]|nr:serine/threonine-protein kinase [Nannocystaceae bacterium]